MPETSPLTRQGANPWPLATPLQLLTLLARLGVSMTEVARWLHVPRSSISMWRRGTRAVPTKHLPALYERTRRTFDARAAALEQAARLAPTAALGQALRAEWETLWARWASEVLAEAGTPQRALARAYATMGRVVQQPHYRRTDVERVQRLAVQVVQSMELIMTRTGEAPDPEEPPRTTLAALLARSPQGAWDLTDEDRAWLAMPPVGKEVW